MASWAQMAAVAAGAPEPPPPAFTRQRVQQQAAQQERAVYQPQGENERVFLAAVDHCFARWSLLRLAVDMGWGDDGGAHNIQLLKEETLEWLQRRRAVQAEPSDLEELLNDFVNDHFHVIAEDGSPREVALLLVQLFQQCSVGDLSGANHLLSLPLPEVGTSAHTAGPEPEEFDGDDMSDDSDDGGQGGGDSNMGQSSGQFDDDDAAIAPTLAPAAPAVDPDGWATVSKGSRKGKGKR